MSEILRPLTSFQWVLAAYAEGPVSKDNFEWQQVELGTLNEGDVLVRVLYLSLDPANRVWISGKETTMPVRVGEVMRGAGVGVVVDSKNKTFPVGQYVMGGLGWREYGLFDADSASKLFRLPPPESNYGSQEIKRELQEKLACLGTIGLTAYFGLLDIGKVKAGETVVVSAAGGATGSLAGQIAKILGCHVIGIAGSDEKCRYIVDEFGFDAAINYKTEKILERLQELCPDGIDVVFENVGGECLDSCLALVNPHARVVLCGLIASYDRADPMSGPTRFLQILIRRVRLEGFLAVDYVDRMDEALEALSGWLKEGKLKYKTTVVEGGLQYAPQALQMLFRGENKGKLMLQVAKEM